MPAIWKIREITLMSGTWFGLSGWSQKKGEDGEAYNLGSGQAWFGNEILKILLGMTRAKIVVETEEKRFRPADPPILLADINRLVKLNWLETADQFEAITS